MIPLSWTANGIAAIAKYLKFGAPRRSHYDRSTLECGRATCRLLVTGLGVPVVRFCIGASEAYRRQRWRKAPMVLGGLEPLFSVNLDAKDWLE